MSFDRLSGLEMHPEETTFSWTSDSNRPGWWISDYFGVQTTGIWLLRLATRHLQTNSQRRFDHRCPPQWLSAGILSLIKERSFEVELTHEHSNSSISKRGLEDDKTRMSNGTGSDRKPLIINTSCESFSHVNSTNRIWLAWFYIWQLFIHKKKKKKSDSDISTSIAGTQVTSSWLHTCHGIIWYFVT